MKLSLHIETISLNGFENARSIRAHLERSLQEQLIHQLKPMLNDLTSINSKTIVSTVDAINLGASSTANEVSVHLSSAIARSISQ